MIFSEGAHEVVLFQGIKPEIASFKFQTEGLLLPAPALVNSSFVPSFAEYRRQFDRPIFSQVLGFLVFAVSFVGVGLTVGPAVASEISFRARMLKRETVRVVKNEPPKPQRLYFSDLVSPTQTEIFPAPVDTDFGIVIPKIGVNVKVTPNVSTTLAKEYLKALSKGVAHAAGTALPDEEGIVYIFGHSTDYPWNVARFNAVFYQIKDLQIADEINLYYHGRCYFYKVVAKKIVAANDTSVLKKEISGKTLILQTCWPPGTTKERLLVYAKPLKEETISL